MVDFVGNSLMAGRRSKLAMTMLLLVALGATVFPGYWGLSHSWESTPGEVVVLYLFVVALLLPGLVCFVAARAFPSHKWWFAAFYAAGYAIWVPFLTIGFHTVLVAAPSLVFGVVLYLSGSIGAVVGAQRGDQGSA